MNDDTISRAAAIEAVEILLEQTEEDADVKTWNNAIRGAINSIKHHVPPAQPEIIHCKDCEHWDTTWQNDFAPNYHYCPLVDGTRRDDFYCADAEMRGEQDE